MPDTHDPNFPPHPEDRPPLTVIPVRAAPRPPYASPFAAFARWVFRTAFLVSVGLNFFLFLLLAAHYGDMSSVPLPERFHSGDRHAADKVAIVKVEGVIMEGMLGYVHKQI